jgi:hypothetical protein
MIEPKDYTPLFLLAASLDGNLEQTALLGGVSLAELDVIASRLRWGERFVALRETRDNEGPDAMARELNRLTNLSQAQRTRDLIDRALEHFSAADINHLTEIRSEKASNYSAKVLVDLVKASETVQNLTYRALGDTATERAASDRGMFGPGRLAAASRGATPAQSLVSALDRPQDALDVQEATKPEPKPEPKPKRKKPKRKPYMRAGRPPGAKNKKKLEPSEAARGDRLMAALDDATPDLGTFE